MIELSGIANYSGSEVLHYLKFEEVVVAAFDQTNEQ